jgi:hypothetical protein
MAGWGMARPRTKTVMGLIVGLVVLILIINLIAGLVGSDQWAVEAAEAAYRERGLQLDKGNTTKSRIRGGFIGKTAEIQFKGMRQDGPASIYVTLRKRVNLMGWEVVEVREELDN